MVKKHYKHIYGPVLSWRLGRSLGVDPIYTGKRKICSFDCIYCQVGKTHILTDERKVFVPTGKIIEEIKSLPPLKIDYITFSGAGEPTLAANLGEIIRRIKKIRKEKIAVLTNSSIIDRSDVRRDLAEADFVIAKIDAHSQNVFAEIDKPVNAVKFETILEGLKKFRLGYRGKFALQIMFVAENAGYAGEIARLARRLRPDEIQINTPLRPCKATPRTRKELSKVKKFFKGTKIISVYDGKMEKVNERMTCGGHIGRRKS